MRKIAILFAFLLFAGMQVVLAQKTITGKVTSSEDGMGIPGASVLVKGTTVGTITDMSGNFTLNVPANATKLIVSFIGMKAVEVEIGAQKTINVILVSDVKNIEGVVVTALGVSREKKALGYSVQEVKSDQLEKSGNVNMMNSLEGKVAGVQITSSSGVAGASTYMIIRGQNSILGNNEPLFIVDGVPIDNGMYASGNPDNGINNLTDGVNYSNRGIDLNPDDIASMSILKGGAATALYGLRAANGAIIITTKKGASTGGKKKVNVEYSYSYSFDKVNKTLDLQNKFGQGRNGNYIDPEGGYTQSWGPLLDTMRYNGDPTYKWDKNGKLVGMSDPTATSKKANAYDNVGDFFQTGHTMTNSINMTGGDDISNFYMSFSNSKTDGVIPNDNYMKTSVKVSGETKLSSKITASGSMNYVKSGGDRTQQGSNLSGVMLALLRTSPSFDNSNGYSDPKTQEAYLFPDGTQRRYSASYDNPYFTINENGFHDDVNRLLGNAYITYVINNYATLTYRLGTDWYSDRRDIHYAINSAAYGGGMVSTDNHFHRDVNSDVMLNLKKDFTNDFKTTLMLGNNMFQTFHKQDYSEGDNLSIPDFYNLSNASSVLVREITDKKRTAAFYGDLGLSYKSLIYLNATGREEWSTTMPKKNNKFFYPSVSAGFVFTEIPALSKNDILSFGKLRASYAVIANDATTYATSTVFTLGTYNDGWTSSGGVSFPMFGQTGFMQNNVLGNQELKPEKLKSFEIGADLRFLKNRANIDVAYYKNKNEDLILAVPLAGSNGYTDVYKNAASMENKGIEIILNLVPVKMKDFQWDFTLNYTKHKNKVTSLAEGVDNVSLGGFTGIEVRVVKDQPYGSIFSQTFYKDPNGNVIINDDPNSSDYGYPMLDPNMHAIGSIQPNWTMGITNELRYKNVTFSFLIDIKNGGLMWDGTRARLNRFGMAAETEDRGTSTVFDGVKGHQLADGTWVYSGTNNIVAVKDQTYYQTLHGDTGSQELFTEKTDWVRLREISITYKLGDLVLGKQTFFKDVQIYVSGKNLLLSTPYKGIDPETNLFGANNAQGLDYFNMPNTKSVIVGLKIKI